MLGHNNYFFIKQKVNKIDNNYGQKKYYAVESWNKQYPILPSGLKELHVQMYMYDVMVV